MTKEEIIEELKKSAKPYEEYYLDDEILSAMLSYQNPYEFVEPILEIISTNPSVDFGMPGDLVHFVEKFYKKGYEELLIDSVKKNPTSHNILMLHRCYNDIKNPNRNEFAKVVKALKNDKSVSIEIKDIIDDPQKGLGGDVDFGEVIRNGGGAFALERKICQADDPIHGRTDFVAHVGEKIALGA